MDLKLLIKKWALHNAIHYDGKANQGAVIGKILSEHKELKDDVKLLAKDVGLVIKEISKLSVEQQKKELEKIAPELLIEQKQEQKDDLPELKNAVKGNVVTRIPPEPSKYNHIGHALIFLINYFYAKRYDGKCVLRIEDTNPEKSTKEFLDAMKEDIAWIGVKWDKEVIASNDMQKFYDHAEILIKKSKAYVCACSQEKVKQLREKKKECECRKNTVDHNLKEWKSMLDKKYKEGERSLRFIGDMKSNNGVMRDPILFRISYVKHFLQDNKYHVWPMYDFENAIEEELCGVTHVIRTTEFMMRAELHNKLRECFGYKNPEVLEIGRFEVEGAETQGRLIRQMIEEKKVTGWDDPRLVTIKALKRRGFIPETFKELAVKIVGLSRTGTKLDWDIISSVNRKILDKKVNRYFFIQDPVEINVEKAPEKKAELKLHPDFVERGKRIFETKGKFYVTKTDFERFKTGKLYRLMDCLNFVNKKGKFVFDSLEYEKYKDKGDFIMHWLPVSKDLVNVEIMMPDAKITKGLAEALVEDLKTDDIIQFERFGFCRLDKKEKDKITFWFTNK